MTDGYRRNIVNLGLNKAIVNVPELDGGWQRERCPFFVGFVILVDLDVSIQEETSSHACLQCWIRARFPQSVRNDGGTDGGTDGSSDGYLDRYRRDQCREKEKETRALQREVQKVPNATSSRLWSGWLHQR
eukprot:g8776.t1